MPPQKKLYKLRFTIILLFIISCSNPKKINQLPEYVYPPDNPFPTIFKIKRYKNQNIGLTAALKPQTIKMSCRLRGDSPYYWCDFEGYLVSQDLNLPSKISSTFHVVVGDVGKDAALKLTSRIKKDNEPVYIVLEMRATISDIDNSIYSQLLGIFNSKECFDVFEDYSLCPNTAKKLDIFSNKYVN